MKKLILLLALITAIVPASADWKAEFADELINEAKEIGQKREAVGKKPTMFMYHTYAKMAEMCARHASLTGDATSEEAIEHSLKVKEMFLRGEEVSFEDIHEVALRCLTHIENVYVQEGFSQQQVEQLISSLLGRDSAVPLDWKGLAIQKIMNNAEKIVKALKGAPPSFGLLEINYHENYPSFRAVMWVCGASVLLIERVRPIKDPGNMNLFVDIGFMVARAKEISSDEDAREIGVQCLTKIENAYIEQGVPKKVTINLMLLAIRELIENPGKYKKDIPTW